MIKKISRKIRRNPFFTYSSSLLGIVLGAFLAACAIQCFLIPNHLIDGGIVGISMIFSYLFGKSLLPLFFLLFNFPFFYLAYNLIGKKFLLMMFTGVAFFVSFLFFFHNYISFEFHGDTLEVIVFAGVVLGAGIGFLIKAGSCLDGTEILAIIINRTKGFTVGQIILFLNFFIFLAAGLAYGDWTPALRSLLTYVVAVKVMDLVILGLDESKSMLIISSKAKEIAEILTKELQLGLTILYGRGGFSSKEQEIIYLVIERIQLAEVKELIYQIDPRAFIAIENIHEVLNGRMHILKNNPGLIKKLRSKILTSQSNKEL